MNGKLKFAVIQTEANRMDENLTLFLFFLERSILPPSHVQLIELCLALS